MRPILPALAILLWCCPAGAQGFDNRLSKPVTSFQIPLRDEVELRDVIDHSNDQKLIEAIRVAPLGALRLKWNRRIALKDADYILCLFDSPGHIEPGDNPRVLVLFTLDYKIATWGAFTCGPAFDYGAIINPIFSSPNTYFVTVNPSSRSGGHLWFEKYRISPHQIEKLGEGAELTKIPEPKLEER